MPRGLTPAPLAFWRFALSQQPAGGGRSGASRSLLRWPPRDDRLAFPAGRCGSSRPNLPRQDAIDFLAIAPKAGVRTETTTYALADANAALSDVRAGRLQGAAVLIP